MTTVFLNTLLEKTTNYDKDERYMATNDLCNELQKDIKIDENMERRICAAVLKQLDDSSNDVQTIAVKCLGILLKKVQQTQVGEICDKLCLLILEGKDELRDIYAIGLKTLISVVPDEMGCLVADRLSHRLLGGISQPANTEIKQECLESMTDLLRRFGHLLEQEHEQIMGAVVQQLEHEKPVIRKRAALCLGALAVVGSDPLLNRLVELVLAQIENPVPTSDVRTLIQTIGTISRTVGYRLGRHLDRIVPLFLRFCGDPEDESQQTDHANELREHCFPALESIVLRCPREVNPHLQAIVEKSIAFMKYDPNYSYDEDEDEGEEEEDIDENEFSDDDYAGSEDDDSSWKVRKSAVKVVAAVISSRPEMLHELYDMCADELITRFKEREENVRLDVINCFTALLSATLASNRARSDAADSKHRLGAAPAGPSLVRQRSAVNQLQDRVDRIMRGSNKQLATNFQKTKSAVFTMLRTLCMVLHGGLDDYLTSLFQSVKKSAGDRNQALKLDALNFVHSALELHDATVLQPHIDDLLPFVAKMVNEEWYKIVAEALRIIGVITTVIRPIDPFNNDVFVGSYPYHKHVDMLYQSILPKLEAHDVDQEIKEAAITAVGHVLCRLGTDLGDRVNTVYQLLLDRLGNDVTRMSVLRSLALIAASPLHLDMSPILSRATGDLAQFLRQQSRALKQTTLQTLDALITTNSAKIPADLIQSVVHETSNLINDADLHLAYLAIVVILSIIRQFPSAISSLRQDVMPRAIELASSALLQGQALRALIQLFQELATIDAEGLTFDNLLQELLQNAMHRAELPKQSVSNLAKCIAGLCVQAGENKRTHMVQIFISDLHSSEERRKHLALLCIGELGQQADLSASGELKDIILEAFESPFEEIKTAAAYALGHLAVGNMPVYLPVVLQAASSSRHQYLLLTSLKEIIVVHANNDLDFQQHIEAVLPGLLNLCRHEEQGVRNMVAECLGTLASIHPEGILPTLQNLAADVNDKNSRWTVATALRFAVSRPFVSSMFAPVLAELLDMLRDEDLDVRRAALQMVNAAVHHHPELISASLPQGVVPVLIETMDLKLHREVDLGPFKHKVDDGLPLRKAALACVDTILDTSAERLDVGAFMPSLIKGLGDADDVKLLSNQVLIKITETAPGTVFGSLDQLVPPLEKTVMTKVKDAQVSTEAERTHELIRSALRAVHAINSKAEDANQNRAWTDFMDRISKRDNLVVLMDAIRKERGFDA